MHIPTKDLLTKQVKTEDQIKRYFNSVWSEGVCLKKEWSYPKEALTVRVQLKSFLSIKKIQGENLYFCSIV